MKLQHIILGDVAIAALAIALWSPIVGLSPFDPNILRAAAAITSYVAIPAAAVMVNRPLLGMGEEEPEEQHMIDPAIRGDALGNGDELRKALQSQSELPHVGTYASDALRQIDAARRKRRQIVDMLSTGKLTPGSLAWQRFVSGIDEAETTIRKNSALVSAACTSFDGNDYEQLYASVSSGEYRNDNLDDEVQVERLRIYQNTIGQLKGLVGNNERLLLELDRFASEVSMQSMTPSDESSERMLTEMRVLIDEARRYG